MALSNIANEPRREIIEQVVGVALGALFLAVDYAIVSWLGPKNLGDWALGMLMLPISVFAGFGLLYLLAVFLHRLGDLACEGLAKLGYDPRPTQRYRRGR